MSDTVKTLLKGTKDKLRAAGIDTWSLDADLLVMRACDLSRVQLVTHDTDPVAPQQSARLESLLAKRLAHMPMQYILGRCEFMGLEYKVCEDVLIPRPDTEILVEVVLAKNPGTALDIGTGSGAIAVALKKYGVKEVTAVDISDKALDTARGNAALNNVEINFVKSDLFENISGRFDAIVSNPPYIASDVIPTLDAQVRLYEPMLALDGGADGLDFYRRIVTGAWEHLNAKSLLAFEIGYDQGAAVSSMMAAAGYKDISVLKDLAGLDRTVMGIKDK